MNHFGAHLGVHIIRQARDVIHIAQAGLGIGSYCLAAHIPAGVDEQGNEHGAVHAVQAFQRPQRADAFGRCGLRIADVGFQSGHRCQKLAIRDGLPGKVRGSGGCHTQPVDQLVAAERSEIRNGHRSNVLVLHAPDSAALLVAIGVIPRHFVVGDDLVVPVDNVQAAVRPQPHGHRAKPLVARLHKITQLLQFVARAIPMNFDRLDFARDRVGHVHHLGVSLRPNGLIAQGQPAQACAAHLEIRRCSRKLRRITFHLRVGTAGIIGVGMERHGGIAIIIGFLNPCFALCIHRQSPDVTRTLAGDLKIRSVCPEPRHAGLVKLDLLAAGIVHFAVIESALGHPHPVAGCACELVGEQM